MENNTQENEQVYEGEGNYEPREEFFQDGGTSGEKSEDEKTQSAKQNEREFSERMTEKLFGLKPKNSDEEDQNVPNPSDETEAENEADEKTQKSQKTPYTSEEMRSLDWQTIDTSRIPAEHQAFYKAMQASFTKKRQAESEAIKKLATDGQLNLQTPLGQGEFDIDDYVNAHKSARQAIRERMPELAPNSPEYGVILSEVTNNIMRTQSEQKSKAQIRLNFDKSSQELYGENFHAVNKLAQEILFDEYPANVSREVVAAGIAGDFTAMRALFDEANKRLTGRASKPFVDDVQRVKITKTPPRTLNAGAKISQREDETKRLLGI